jgi:hypothetical protein
MGIEGTRSSVPKLVDASRMVRAGYSVAQVRAEIDRTYGR